VTTVNPFTLADLRRTLLAGAGADEAVDLDGDIEDVEFDDLGYDSIALLETTSRIERERGVSLDEDSVATAKTPRELIDLVNAQLNVQTA
jgi:act minimal PKS acyl carrier protein